jgi:DNA helicase HerA-like ATPase
VFPVGAIDTDGLMMREDGVYVRFVEASVVNALVLDEGEAERVSVAFGQLAARLSNHQVLQLYVQASPLPLETLLEAEAQRTTAAAAQVEAARARAMHALAAGQAQSLRAHTESAAAVVLRHIVICPWQPDTRGRLARGGNRAPVSAMVHERAVRESARHTEGVRADLEAMDLHARVLGGREVLDLCWQRLDPHAAAAGELPPSSRSPEVLGGPVAGESAFEAAARARALREAVCTAGIGLRDPATIRVGGCVELVSYVSLAPELTWLGWVLHFMQAPLPFVLSVHVEGTERYRERLAQRRRYKRLYGVNRGSEQRGRPLDPQARLAEEEAAELNDELATGTGTGIYRTSIYLALREPDGQLDVLRELALATGREVMMASDARVLPGLFAQGPLWRSTLPLGLDVARRQRRYVTRNVADSFPLVGTSCGSPRGVLLGIATPGRTLERLDPFDAQHENHLTLINGMSGSGKTMLTVLLLARAVAHGAVGWIIDRAGHFDFLVSLIPGARTVAVGGGGHAINPWDVPDPGRVEPEKVDYLLSLHALLLGEHHADRDQYGLSDLEQNLLGLAITRVYDRCDLTGEPPRELLLQEELYQREADEKQAGATEIAAALRNLAIRLNNYVLDGPYAYLADLPTTVPNDAPLVVFDTRSIPEAKAAAALFVICEHVRSRIEDRRRTHLSGRAAGDGWAGRSLLVIDEAWKLIERPATGRWFNEFVRRSRHYALWLVAISQQLSDFDNEHGRALLANAAMKVFLRQQSGELAHAQAAIRLTDEEVHTISSLRTAKREYALAYVINGTRGRGTVQIKVGPLEYWTATSDPDRDEPLRQQALRETNGDAWQALALLANRAWHNGLVAEAGEAGR